MVEKLATTNAACMEKSFMMNKLLQSVMWSQWSKKVVVNACSKYHKRFTIGSFM
jgi:hypothetical protein